jgi:hypothetical protein
MNKELIISLAFTALYLPLALIFWYEFSSDVVVLLGLLIICILLISIFLVASLLFSKPKIRNHKPIKLKRVEEECVEISEPEVIEESDNLLGFRKLFSNNNLGGTEKSRISGTILKELGGIRK